MGGWQLGGEALNPKDIPIVILTAYPNADELAKEAGAEDFLSKPFELVELWKTAAKYAQSAMITPIVSQLKVMTG